jgi:beta-galactosidase
VQLTSPALGVPAHLWISEIQNNSAQVIGQQSSWITAVRGKVGRGEAIWVPSPIGLGAWLHDNRPLATWLRDVTAPFTRDLPFRFPAQQPGCLMRTLANGTNYVTVITNGTAEPLTCRVQHRSSVRSQALWGEGMSGDAVSLGARGTSVLLWK